MRFKKTFVIFLISLILLNFSLIYATNINKQTADTCFRIHIVANSDSIDDQLLKYTLAKKINAYITELTANCNSKEESKQLIETNMQNILTLCNNIIIDQNCNYDVKAYIGKIEYSAKYKDGNKMTPGIYDSLKIIIGNGNGQNWWSLIYPTNFLEQSPEVEFNEDVSYSLGIVEFIKKLINKES